MTDTPTDALTETLDAHVHASELIDALATRDPEEPLRVSSPNIDFDGEVGGMRFTKGVYIGLVTDAAVVYLLNAGYTVEPVPDAVTTPAAPSPEQQAALDAAVEVKVAEKLEATVAQHLEQLEVDFDARVEQAAATRADQLVTERLDAAVEAAIKDRGLVPKPARKPAATRKDDNQ